MLAGSLASAACYSADLETEISAVYVCEEDIDCAIGHVCAGGLCRSEGELVGPSLEITDPPLLHVFEQGTGMLPITFRGSNLQLTSRESDALEAGYIEIYVDGALVDAVTEGDVEKGINLRSLPMPREGGLHHVVLSARHMDGERFDNPESEAHIAFWVDDGLEHVGILEPAPASRVGRDSPELEIEVAALNFTFVNPGFLAPDEGLEPLQGYVHLYIDADVPSCLPACNYDYQASIIPPGLARVNRLAAEQGLVLPDGVGTVRLQIVAQTTANAPYYRDETQSDVVYYEVPVQSVLGLDR
jgi:hypothetical protein